MNRDRDRVEGLGLKVEGFGHLSLARGVVGVLIDSCITQLKSQGPSRTCDESKEKDEEECGTHFILQTP